MPMAIQGGYVQGGVVNAGYGGNVVNAGYGGNVVNAGYGGSVVNAGYGGTVVNSGNYANCAPVVRSASFQANTSPIIQGGVVNAGCDGYGGGVVTAGCGNIASAVPAVRSGSHTAGYGVINAGYGGGGVINAGYGGVVNAGYGGNVVTTGSDNNANYAPVVRSASFQATAAPITQGGVVNGGYGGVVNGGYGGVVNAGFGGVVNTGGGVITTGYGGGVVNTGSGDAGYNNGYNNGYAAGLKAGQGVPFMNATPVAPAPVTYAGATCYTAPTTTVSNSNYVPAGVTPVYTGYTASPAVVQQEFVMGQQELAVIEPCFVEEPAPVFEPVAIVEDFQTGVTREM